MALLYHHMVAHTLGAACRTLDVVAHRLGHALEDPMAARGLRTWAADHAEGRSVGHHAQPFRVDGDEGMQCALARRPEPEKRLV